MTDRKPGTFTKGDPRINRKGRPRSFDALRELARQIAHEAVLVGDKKMTVIEAILRQWAQSKNPQLQRGFVEIAYGKVPDEMRVGGNGNAIIIHLVDETEQPDADG